MGPGLRHEPVPLPSLNCACCSTGVELLGVYELASIQSIQTSFGVSYDFFQDGLCLASLGVSER
jgi:hypothetical protein